MISDYKKILLFNTLFRTFRMLTGATSVIFLMQKGLPESELLSLKMVTFIFIALFDVPLSYWADNKSKRLSITLGAGAASLWLFLTAIAPNTVFLYIGEFFNAVSISLYGGASTAFLINIYKKSQRNERASKNGADTAGSAKTEHSESAENSTDSQKPIAENIKLGRIGMILGVIICGLVPFNFLEYLWLSSAALLCILTVLGWRALPKDDDSSSAQAVPALSESMRSIRQALSGAHIIALAVLHIAVVVYFNVIVNYNQIALIDYAPRFEAPIFFSILFIIILLVQAVASKLCERISFNLWIVTTILIMGLFLQLAPFAFSEAKLALFIVNYFFMMILMVGASARIQNKTPDNLRATVHSVFYTTSMLGASALSLAISFLYESLQTVLLVTGLLMLLPLVLNLMLMITGHLAPKLFPKVPKADENLDRKIHNE